jgi:hypothetical protein
VGWPGSIGSYTEFSLRPSIAYPLSAIFVVANANAFEATMIDPPADGQRHDHREPEQVADGEAESASVNTGEEL